MNPAQRTQWVVEQARAVGFDLCGVAPAEDFEELTRLPEWLERGYAGEMNYLRDARRGSPGRALEGAGSIIVCALNYNTPRPYSTEVPFDPAGNTGPRGWFSRYAWGDDYHEVLQEKLEALLDTLREKFREPFQGRAYVDTGPVVERVAARHAGLGWLAKNTCLINEKLGSWLFLGVIVTTLDLAPSLGPAEASPADLCGNCRLCIDACPTGAIVEPYVLDARRCISYLTIELRGTIPEEFRSAMGRHVFGCDICQDVCPWNRAAPTTGVAAFLPRRLKEADEAKKEARNSKLETRSAQPLRAGLAMPGADAGADAPHDSLVATRHSLFLPSLEWLASLTEEEFRQVFRSSAVKRAKWQGLVRNACIALGNSGLQAGTTAHERIVALLERLAAADDAIIAEHAHWALGRLQ